MYVRLRLYWLKILDFIHLLYQQIIMFIGAGLNFFAIIWKVMDMLAIGHIAVEDWGQEPKSTLCSAKLYNLWVCFVSAKRKIYEQKPKATYRINFLGVLRKVPGIWRKFEWLIQRSRKIICNKNHLDIRSFKDKGTGNVYQIL